MFDQHGEEAVAPKFNDGDRDGNALAAEHIPVSALLRDEEKAGAKSFC
jgi:hypothetical protein